VPLADGRKGEEWDFDLLTPCACGHHPRCTRKKKRQQGSDEKRMQLVAMAGIANEARPELKLRKI
jgi:hypothetical protein